MDKQTPKHKGLYILPSLFTLANMGLGYYAIIAALDNKWITATAMITISVLMDGLDGRIARATKTTSEFGLNFDSLVDAISFGVAPAVIIYYYWINELQLNDYRLFAIILTFIYIATGAMRLARFNVLTKSNLPNTYFIGLPIPAAAGLVSTAVWVYEKYPYLKGNPDVSVIFKRLLPAVVLIVSYLMISKVRYYSFKQAKNLVKRPIIFLIAITLMLYLLLRFPSITLFCIGIIYVSSGPVRALFSISKIIEKKNEMV